METRKKIDFDFITKNFSIIKENFLITEINGKKYIGRLSSVSDDWLKLDEVRSLEGDFRGTHITFNRSITDIFLPSPVDIGKLGYEILLEYHSTINNSIVQPHMVFLEEVNQILDEQEKNEKLVKKFNDFCDENNIDEQDVWKYLNDKSEKERW